MAEAQQKSADLKTVPIPASAHVLLRNIGYLAGSQVTTWVVSLLYIVIVTRAIGPRSNGELSAATAFYGILVPLAALGTSTYLVKEIASDPARAPRLVASALTVKLLALPPAVAVVTAYLIVSHFSREMTIVFILFGAGLLPSLCSPALQAALQGIQRMGAIALSGILNSLVYDTVAIVLVLLGHRNVILIASLLLATMYVSMLLTVAIYRRHFATEWKVRLQDVLSVIRGGFPFLATQVAYTLYVGADTVILTSLSSSTEVGWYGAVSRLFSSLLFVSTILSTVWLPRMSAHARHDPAALRRETQLVFRLALLSAVPLAVGGSLVAGRLVHVFWGHAYAGASAPMSVLLLALPATSISTVLYSVLVARGKAGTWAWVMAVALALNVIANIGLVLWFRSEGRSTALAAALCLNLTEAGMAVVAIWIGRHLLGLGMLWYGVRALAAGLLMGAVVVLLAHLPLAVLIMAGALVFCPLAVAFRLVTGPDLAAMRGLLSKLLHR